MSTTSSDNEKILGSLNGIVAKASFLVHDLEKMWLVESGSVDLFLVQIQNGEPTGARHHVLRVKQGGAIFGAGTTFSSAMRLLAAATPGSCILEPPLARLQDVASSPSERKHSARLLESWIVGLCRAATGDVLPKVFEFLEPGSALALKEAKVVLPRKGVVWVRLLEGNVRFLGEYKLSPLEGHALFPVPSSAWLEADKNSRLSLAETTEIIERDLLWNGLQLFHDMVLDRVVRNLQLAREKELERLERRSKLDEARLDFAIRLLASPLERAPDIPVLEDAQDDPWLLACHALGEDLGIQFKPHLDQHKGIVPKDPVSGIARASGVRVRTVALRGDWWKQDNGPLLARRESDRAPSCPPPRAATGSTTRWPAPGLPLMKKLHHRWSPLPGVSIALSPRKS